MVIIHTQQQPTDRIQKYVMPVLHYGEVYSFCLFMIIEPIPGFSKHMRATDDS